jgi:hypothetical protein
VAKVALNEEKMPEESFVNENTSPANRAKARGEGEDQQRKRFMFSRLTVLIFMFVCVRGPLFRVEDLTELGWDRVSSWKVLRNLVKAGILEKFDRRSYGLTEDARKWFRSAFGGGVNDATFAYSVMGVEAWSVSRLNHFKTNLSAMWEERPERVKQDPSRVGLTRSDEEEHSTLETLLFEKVEEANYLVSMLEEKRAGRHPLKTNVA